MELKTEVNSIGELLYFHMMDRRKGVREAGRELGISPATISRITQGKGFEIKWLLPIARWCGIDAQQMWDLLEE